MHTPSGEVNIRRDKPDKPASNKSAKSGARSKPDAISRKDKQIKITAVLLAIFSFLLLLALVSYTPKDELNTHLSFSEFIGIFTGDEAIRAKVDTTHNWLGLFGAVIANFFYNSTIGILIFGLPFFLFVWAKELFVRRRIPDLLLRRTNVYLIISTLVAAFIGTLQRVSWMFDIPKEFSGAVGRFMANILSGAVNEIGAVILFAAGILVTVILGTEINVDNAVFRLRPYYKEMKIRLRNKLNAIYISLKSGLFKEKTSEDIPDEVPEIIEKKEINNETPESEPKEQTQSEPEVQTNEIVRNETKDDFVKIIRSKPGQSPGFGQPIINRHVYTPPSQNDNPIRSEQKAPPQAARTEVFDMPEDDIKKDEFNENINKTEEITPEPVKNETAKPESIATPDKSEITQDPPAEDAVPEPAKPAPAAEPEPQPVQKPEPAKNPLTVTVMEKDKPKEDTVPEYPLSTAIHKEKIDYKYPTIDLLRDDDGKMEVNDEELELNARILQEKLETFKIFIENLSVTPGPVVTQYEFVPAPGIKISKIESLADDLAMALKARGIRIIAPIPGKGTVGIEIPNQNPSLVRFSSVVKSNMFFDSKHKLPLALGKTISGEVFIADLAKMPHLLIAGSTGAGKSVGINTIIISLLYKMHPRNLKFAIIDPKKVELQQYSHLSNHFLAVSPDIDDSIVTSPKDAVILLKSVVLEMEKRYDILADAGQRNITDYNRKVRDGKIRQTGDIKPMPMPYIVVIIDELADLMLTASKEVEEPIIRLAQMARAVGIHCIIATQRPSVDVITGIIKANFPARAAYLVASKVDSRTILDASGAEQLLGNGDMLFLPSGQPKPSRLQNAFITTDEVEGICEYIGDQDGYSSPYILPSLKENESGAGGIDAGDRDPLFEEAARLIIRHQQGSVSLVQRRLKVGYARAGRIVDELEAAGIVGPNEGSKSRQVLMESESELEAVL